MADIVSKKKRSEIMSRIGGKDTKPEMIVRKGLHRLGYRYRLHIKKLPGKPDVYFPKYNALIEVNGCFWHGHDCHIYRLPKSRTDYWKKKIERNRERDKQNFKKIIDMGYRLLVVWECSLKGKEKKNLGDLLAEIEKWLHSDIKKKEIRGLGS